MQKVSFILLLFILSSCVTPSILVTQEQQKGDTCNNRNNYAEAIQHYKKCLEASKQLGIYRNTTMEANVCRKIAHAFETQGNYNEALPYVDQALAIDSLEVNKIEIADDYREKGNIFLYLGNFHKGILWLNKSLNASEKLFNSLKDVNKKPYASTLFSLGEISAVLGRLNEAIEYLNKANKIFNEINDWQGLMESEIVLAEIYTDYGDYDFAETLLYRLIKRAEEHNINTSRQNHLLGQIAGMKGEYENELKYKLKALDEADKSNIIPQVIWSLVETGDAYYALSDFKRANEYYEKAIKLKKSKQMEAQSIDASLKMRTGDASAALQYYSQSGSQLSSALALLRMAETYSRRRQSDSTLYCYNEALQYFTQSHIKEGIAKVCLLKGRFYIDSDSLENASKFLDLSKENTRKPEILWQYWFQKGRLYEKQNQLDSAKNAYIKSIDIIENLRSKITVEELKSSFLNTKVEVYDRLIMLLIKMGLTSEAYNVSERARSRAFLDMLTNKKIDVKENDDKELIENEQSLRLQIVHLSQMVDKYDAEDISDSLTLIKFRQIKEELANTQQKYDELIQKLKLKKSKYTSLITVEPVSIKDIQQSLDNKTVLLEYWISTEKLVIWVVSNNEVKIKTVDVKGDDLRDEIMTCRAFLKRTNDKVFDYAKEAYDKLILPVENDIKGFQTICIVPHNVLHLLPFQALIDQNSQFLAEKFSIYYAPSGSIYLQCKKSTSEAGNKFLGMALGDLEINQFSGLPGTSLEVAQISKLYPEETVRLKEETTETFLKQEAGNFNIIHLATHGYFNCNDPMYSFILFAPTTVDDGKLMVREVFGLTLKSKLVTLSACETGLSDISQGDEMVGLSRAFIYAGTPSIIVSLWSVSDESTALLMSNFYKNLQTHNLNDALVLAQRDLIKKYKYPFYWAPFILIGSAE